MEPAFVGLLTAGIGFARSVLTLFVGQSEGGRRTERSVTIIRERVLDKEALKRIINETNQHFSKMLESHTGEIIKAVQRQRVQDAVQEVQARVNALKVLLNAQNIDPNLTMQLVISALNPLQVSLEVAKFRLQDYGDPRTWQFCHIVGASALISGYAFLGQDVSHMVVELEEAMYETQKQVLNEAAVKIVASQKEIPWERVQFLLLPEGADELLELYNSVTEELASAYDVSAMSVEDIQIAVRKINNAAVLRQMQAQEAKGKNRTGALQAIASRLTSLPD